MNGVTQSVDKSQAGFTLIEILVAFTIATLLLGALYQIFSSGLRSGSIAAEHSNAVLLAESALEVFGIEETLVVGEVHDRVDRKYERHVVVRSRPDLLPGGIVRPALAPYEVEISVTWRSGRQSRSVSLSTIRLGLPP
jgi:general secretion pathway protein I